LLKLNLTTGKEQCWPWRKCSRTIPPGAPTTASLHKTFVRLIASGYLLTGFYPVRLLGKRLDPVFPPRHSRSGTTIMHSKDEFSDHMTLGEALMRLGGPGKGITFGEGNPELGGLDRRIQALEFATA
jgi:hypothetical protein